MNNSKKYKYIFGNAKCNTMFRIEYDTINEELYFGDPMIEKDYNDGFFVISECVSYSDSIRFIDYLKNRYPFDLPDFFRTYLEFQLFLSLN